MSRGVSVVGLGKLGSGLAAVIADAGFQTVGVDINDRLVQMINSGTTTDVEPDLRELIGKHGGKALVATTAHDEAVHQSDVTFLLVATPSNVEGHFSNQFLQSALEALAKALAESDKPFHTFVISSTVTPGAIEGTLVPILERHSGRKLNEGFGVCYDPEFVALGTVVKGFREPDVVVIGESAPHVGDIVEKIHHRVCRNQPVIRRMSIINAEVAKVSLNVFMTMKISFGNMLANLCENVPGANPDVIADAIGQDRRIAPYYLKGGLAFGGPCFPRDTKALSAFMRQKSVEPILIDAVDRVNENQQRRLLEKTLAALPVTGRRSVGLLGLSFKPGTAVITESPSVRLVHELLERNIDLVVYDPHAFPYVQAEFDGRIRYASSAAEVIEALPVVVIANPDAEYKAALEAYRGAEVRQVIDCWRIADPAVLAPSVQYTGLGLASAKPRVPVLEKLPLRKDEYSRGNILGVGVGALNIGMAVDRIAGWVERRDPNYVLAVPAHCIVECLRDEDLRAIYNRAGMVTPDGMPIAWILKMMGYKHVDRVYGPDLMLAVCKHGVSRGYRHFLYGGWPPSVVEKLAVKLREKFPGIQIAGTFAPPFRPVTPQEDAEIVEKINAARPDIVWVGLGAAKEEFFCDSHLGKLAAPVMCGVGAAFDFHAGVKPQAPRWMMRAGLEWFFRVLTEPKRLAPRYLKDNPVFLWNIMLQALGKEPPPISANQ